MSLYTYSPFIDMSPFSEEFRVKLDEMFNELKRLNEINESLEEFLPFFQRDYQGGGDQLTPVVVKGHIVNPNPFSIGGGIGAHQWLYTLNRVTYVSGGYSEDEVLAMESAVNVRELGHFKPTAFSRGVAWGVDMDLTSYPAGFDAKAVGGSGTGPGHTHDVPTVAWSQSVSGQTTWFFSEMGSHDGECQ
jgi:hypothetical protein